MPSAKPRSRRSRASEREARINVRFNDREWRLDPERLERIKEQARKAASEGIAGALEAVERAVSNLGIPKTPTPPKPQTTTATVRGSACAATAATAPNSGFSAGNTSRRAGKSGEAVIRFWECGRQHTQRP